MFGNQSQFKQQKYQQFEVRKTGYGQTWNTELKTACCADPGCECSRLCTVVFILSRHRKCCKGVFDLTGNDCVCRLPPCGVLVRLDC